MKLFRLVGRWDEIISYVIQMNYTARQAFVVSNQVLNNFEAVYTHITYMCMETIQRFAEFHFNHCSFTIPRYIMGFASFDNNSVRKRLKKHLRDLEYKCKTSKSDKKTILISWKHLGKKIMAQI